MYQVQDHLLCLDCYDKLLRIAERQQHAHQARSAELASMMNYLTESMAWQAGLRSTPPRLQVPQPIHATVNKGPTLNNINIDRSVIGMLNAGQIQDVQNISINVSALVESGNSDVAQALKTLTESVAASEDISDEQRTELLEQLDELSSQAALPPEKRAKSGVIKAILASLGAGLSVAGNLAQIWSTWGATISSFFGV
jgi:hypothetical protein